MTNIVDRVYITTLLIFKQQKVQSKTGNQAIDNGFLELYSPREVLRGGVHSGVHDYLNNIKRGPNGPASKLRRLNAGRAGFGVAELFIQLICIEDH